MTRYGMATWLGWVNEYNRDNPEGVDPQRVEDVGTYLGCIMDPNGEYDLPSIMTLLGDYQEGGPEVEDHWTQMDTEVVENLKGYLGMRYENALEG